MLRNHAVPHAVPAEQKPKPNPRVYGHGSRKVTNTGAFPPAVPVSSEPGEKKPIPRWEGTVLHQGAPVLSHALKSPGCHMTSVRAGLVLALEFLVQEV